MSTEDRKDIIPFETICNNHNHVVHLLQQYKKTRDIWYVDQAIKLVRHCKKQGQHMENRLKKYQTSIISLGFQRVKKPKKKPTAIQYAWLESINKIGGLAFYADNLQIVKDTIEKELF